ncbi:MAG: hypothetical protein HFJ38_05745 [Bacilli bacterium]|nr:hypothetical protein [Bacilli bacterium]
MDKLELNINNKQITLRGKNAVIEKERLIIEGLNLTGNEYNDRLTLQKCIDDENLKSEISYSGSTVYPFEKTVKQYRNLQKTDSLENMTMYMYHFFIYECGDIAHYDIHGFRDYYNNSLRNLENQLLNNSNWVWTRNSDIDKIFKEIKIGKYFEEREQININKISLNTLKSIIKECGWEISINGNGLWRLSKNIKYNVEYSFNVEVLNNSISNIVQEIQNTKKYFDKDKYIETMVDNRKETESPLSISEMVGLANNISYVLMQLSSNILYKSRVAAEETKGSPPEEKKLDNNVQQISLFMNYNNRSSSNTVPIYSNEDYENDIEICG